MHDNAFQDTHKFASEGLGVNAKWGRMGVETNRAGGENKAGMWTGGCGVSDTFLGDPIMPSSDVR